MKNFTLSALILFLLSINAFDALAQWDMDRFERNRSALEQLLSQAHYLGYVKMPDDSGFKGETITITTSDDRKLIYDARNLTLHMMKGDFAPHIDDLKRVHKEFKKIEGKRRNIDPEDVFSDPILHAHAARAWNDAFGALHDVYLTALGQRYKYFSRHAKADEIYKSRSTDPVFKKTIGKMRDRASFATMHLLPSGDNPNLDFQRYYNRQREKYLENLQKLVK